MKKRIQLYYSPPDCRLDGIQAFNKGLPREPPYGDARATKYFIEGWDYAKQIHDLYRQVPKESVE